MWLQDSLAPFMTSLFCVLAVIRPVLSLYASKVWPAHEGSLMDCRVVQLGKTLPAWKLTVFLQAAQSARYRTA